jgi:hypothetical protein
MLKHRIWFKAAVGPKKQGRRMTPALRYFSRF